MSVSRKLELTSLAGFPMVQPGDDLADQILDALKANQITLQDGDVLVLAQKIVSKAESRLVNLTEVAPTDRARKVAAFVNKRPELVQLILDESNEVLRMRPGTLIVEHRSGFVCANAGIDHSNVSGSWGEPSDWVLLLPEDSDLSAQRLREQIQAKTGVQVGVLIIDSHGRAWRNGIVGACIGLAGLPGVVDMRGEKDLNAYALRVTTIAAADELAAAASLVMGQAAEGTPVVHVRGFPYPSRDGSAAELVRKKENDLFR